MAIKGFKPTYMYVNSLGTISEGSILKNISAKETAEPNIADLVPDSRRDCYKKIANKSNGENNEKTLNFDVSIVEGIQHFIVDSDGDLCVIKRTNKSGFQSCPSITRQNDREYMKSLRFSKQEHTDEILTPYDATKHTEIKPPSYWVGCSYTHRPMSNRLDLMIRQTGVIPDVMKQSRFSKLKLIVQLRTSNKRLKRTVTLMKSRADRSFRSSAIDFKNISSEDLKTAYLVIEVMAHKLFTKKKLAEEKISLSNCRAVFSKTEWCRIVSDH